MKFKLVIALVSDDYTEKVIDRARELGATGATVLTNGRGEGLNPHKSFLGLTIEGQVDMVMFIVEQHISRKILEGVAEVAKFDTGSGTGIAIQLDIEDAVGMKTQLHTIEQEIEDQI